MNDGKLKKLNSENKQKRISVSHLCDFLKLKVSQNMIYKFHKLQGKKM